MCVPDRPRSLVHLHYLQVQSVHSIPVASRLDYENGLVKLSAKEAERTGAQAELDDEYEFLSREYYNKVDQQKQNEEVRNSRIKRAAESINEKKSPHIAAICISIQELLAQCTLDPSSDKMVCRGYHGYI